MLLAPDNASGSTQLAAVPASDVVTASEARTAGDAPLVVATSLELPEDDWAFVASDGPMVLLRSFPAYVLVQVDPDASLTVVGSATLSDPRGGRLIGTTLYTADAEAPQQLDLAP